ncbi:MAG TPA: transglycosylase family protein [Pseudonocardiaceae bacterium]|nr:transglycosylase family protein [Pseudonocardiaceae bacterium]
MARTAQLLARIGIAAAALAAPLVFPAPAKADAARHELWDRVALCESGGNWSANTGNGYYGGLQFTRSTWSSFGGRTYARTANYATRLQQIAIAERVLRVQGWDAWPTCSVKAGVR